MKRFYFIVVSITNVLLFCFYFSGICLDGCWSSCSSTSSSPPPLSLGDDLSPLSIQAPVAPPLMSPNDSPGGGGGRPARHSHTRLSSSQQHEGGGLKEHPPEPTATQNTSMTKSASGGTNTTKSHQQLPTKQSLGTNSSSTKQVSGNPGKGPMPGALAKQITGSSINSRTAPPTRNKRSLEARSPQPNMSNRRQKSLKSGTIGNVDSNTTLDSATNNIHPTSPLTSISLSSAIIPITTNTHSTTVNGIENLNSPQSRTTKLLQKNGVSVRRGANGVVTRVSAAAAAASDGSGGANGGETGAGMTGNGSGNNGKLTNGHINSHHQTLQLAIDAAKLAALDAVAKTTSTNGHHEIGKLNGYNHKLINGLNGVKNNKVRHSPHDFTKQNSVGVDLGKKNGYDIRLNGSNFTQQQALHDTHNELLLNEIEEENQQKNDESAGIAKSKLLENRQIVMNSRISGGVDSNRCVNEKVCTTTVDLSRISNSDTNKLHNEVRHSPRHVLPNGIVSQDKAIINNNNINHGKNILNINNNGFVQPPYMVNNGNINSKLKTRNLSDNSNLLNNVSSHGGRNLRYHQSSGSTSNAFSNSNSVNSNRLSVNNNSLPSSNRHNNFVAVAASETSLSSSISVTNAQVSSSPASFKYIPNQALSDSNKTAEGPLGAPASSSTSPGIGTAKLPSLNHTSSNSSSGNTHSLNSQNCVEVSASTNNGTAIGGVGLSGVCPPIIPSSTGISSLPGLITSTIGGGNQSNSLTAPTVVRFPAAPKKKDLPEVCKWKDCNKIMEPNMSLLEHIQVSESLV